MIRFKEVLTYLLLGVAVSIVGSNVSFAKTDIASLIADIQYQYNPPTFAVCANGTVDCKEVGKRDEFVLIHADGGPRCPAGYYFMANSKKSEIEPIIAPTCDPSLQIKFVSSGRAFELTRDGKVFGTVPLDH